MISIKIYLNRITSHIAIIVIGMAIFGCSSENEPKNITPNLRVDIALDSKSRATADKLKDTYTNLTINAVDVLDNGYIVRGNNNVIISPLSMSLVLSMVANGIEPESQKSLADYLGVEDIEGVNSLANTLLRELPKVDNQTTIYFANSAWIDNPLTLKNDFATLVEDNYNASIHYDELHSDTSVEKINNWCADNTNGLVPEMVFSIPEPNVFAMFFNAMFFQSKWSDSLIFDPQDTEKKIFHGSKGDSKVDMMHAYDFKGDYYCDDNFEVCVLPFGNGAFKMSIVLPNTNLSLEEANSLLTPQLVDGTNYKIVNQLLDIALPRFEVKDYIPMNDILSISGLDKFVYGDHSFNMFIQDDFNGIISTYQGTSFKIDESGATAAAVSQVTTGYTSNMGKNFIVDRPFYFFINEVSTDACILSGRIADL